jgi:hypothetical protein
MAIEKVSVADYAKQQGKSKQAITKTIRKNDKDNLALHSGLPGVTKVETFANAYVLYQRI